MTNNENLGFPHSLEETRTAAESGRAVRLARVLDVSEPGIAQIKGQFPGATSKISVFLTYYSLGRLPYLQNKSRVRWIEG